MILVERPSLKDSGSSRNQIVYRLAFDSISHFLEHSSSMFFLPKAVSSNRGTFSDSTATPSAPQPSPSVQLRLAPSEAIAGWCRPSPPWPSIPTACARCSSRRSSQRSDRDRWRCGGGFDAQLRGRLPGGCHGVAEAIASRILALYRFVTFSIIQPDVVGLIGISAASGKKGLLARSPLGVSFLASRGCRGS